MCKNEENAIFSPFSMEKIYKNWARLKLSKMKNKIVKRSALGIKYCKNKFCKFFFTNNTLSK